jgi:hypothetical protein
MSSFENYDPLHLDHYDYKLELRGISGVIRRALWFAAGGDIKLLERCPHSERVKYEGLGGVVMATAILAFFSGFFAMYTVFGPVQILASAQDLDTNAAIKSFVVATIWALIIFNLDRFIITSTGHGNGTEDITAKELFQALPRIIMAIVIGLSISAPLEIRVLKTELDARILQERDDRVEKDKIVINQEFDRIKQFNEENQHKAEHSIQDIDAYKKKLDDDIKQQRKELDDEFSGKAGNKKKGKGPGFSQKKENLDKMESENNQKIIKLDIEKEELEKIKKTASDNLEKNILERDQKINDARVKESGFDGISKRIEYAHKDSPKVSLALTLLLVIIEITPIFIKMMLIRGPYDYLTDNQNKILLAKYAIETRQSEHNGYNTEHSIEDVYHQPKTIESHVIGNLVVESQLAEQAREIFLNTVKEDMKADPERYMPDLNKTKA